MNGILLVDKPKGWTSHDVVAKIRGILNKVQKQQGDAVRKVRVGHAGTLDPMATGLLVILIGNYTKRAQEFTKLDKTYVAEVTLGFNSNTDDSEGELTKIYDDRPTERQAKEALEDFLGEQEQVPPQFSAIKVDGKRAYKIARAGKTTALKPREITIYTISGIKYDYPKISFEVSVSSGTYIRSLARDIGKKLGTGAYLSDLRRTSTGVFSIESSIEQKLLNYNKIKHNLITLD